MTGEALAFTQALPGSTGIQVVAYLGWRLRCWPSALAAAGTVVLAKSVLGGLHHEYSLASSVA